MKRLLSTLFSKKILREFCSKSFAFLIILTVFRIGEHIALNTFHDIDVTLYHQHFNNSLIRDALYAFHISAILLPLYLLIGKVFSVKLANKFFVFSGVLLLIIHLLLTRYFFSTMMLLDRIIVTVPLDQLQFIFQSELDWSDLSVYLFFITCIATLTGYILLSKVNLTNKVSFYLYCLLFITSFCLIPINYLPKDFFRDSLSHNLVNNKEIYLVRDIINRGREHENLNNTDQIEVWIEKYHQQNDQFTYLYKDYPLLHKNDYENVLAPWFELKENQKPNFVFILGESISRTFSGPNSEYGSFTPFLDSLAVHSLYFENFLSNADKTYGIYTNLYASMPNANERGLINLGDQIPRHHSVFSILGENGYQNNAFYTGWEGFDRMNEYFDLMKFDHYFHDMDFPESNRESTKTTWGTSDHYLYQRSFDLMKQYNITNPYSNFFIPISLHSPYIIPASHSEMIAEQYKAIVEKYSGQGHDKELYNKYDEIFRTCLYADQAMREFIEDYKKRADFENTIFIIAGDHNIGSIPTKNILQLYHVPLVIYSPLLKKSGAFKAINTHRDVIPSVLQLLKEQYSDFSLPATSHWIGTGLDLEKDFRSKKKDTFSSFAGERGYMKNLYFYDKDFGTYEIHDNIELTKIDDKTITKELEDRFKTWVMVSTFCVNKDWVTPSK